MRGQSCSFHTRIQPSICTHCNRLNCCNSDSSSCFILSFITVHQSVSPYPFKFMSHRISKVPWIWVNCDIQAFPVKLVDSVLGLVLYEWIYYKCGLFESHWQATFTFADTSMCQNLARMCQNFGWLHRSTSTPARGADIGMNINELIGISLNKIYILL